MNRYEEFLSRLLKGEIILIDGGTGTEVERRGVPQLKNAWNAGGALTHPVRSSGRSSSTRFESYWNG